MAYVSSFSDSRAMPCGIVSPARDMESHMSIVVVSRPEFARMTRESAVFWSCSFYEAAWTLKAVGMRWRKPVARPGARPVSILPPAPIADIVKAIEESRGVTLAPMKGQRHAG